MTVRFVVTGVVQGVGFRYFVARQAEVLGLAGWVRNLPDGTVEVLAQGDEESVNLLAQSLRTGPRLSRVQSVTRHDVPDDTVTSNMFDIR